MARPSSAEILPAPSVKPIERIANSYEPSSISEIDSSSHTHRSSHQTMHLEKYAAHHSTPWLMGAFHPASTANRSRLFGRTDVIHHCVLRFTMQQRCRRGWCNTLPALAHQILTANPDLPRSASWPDQPTSPERAARSSRTSSFSSAS